MSRNVSFLLGVVNIMPKIPFTTVSFIFPSQMRALYISYDGIYILINKYC
jgi:hypothetical protein